MIVDEQDTIVAPATGPGQGLRGVVRISGPEAWRVLTEVLQTPPTASPSGPRLVEDLSATVDLAGRNHALAVNVFVWPDERSYTRSPTVELHTQAAAPLLDALVRACCNHGARLAKPGEFTLRAFLSGRLDLMQAEAVLGVIDAEGDAALEHALGRLAGGLSTPLQRLKEDLTQLLAELEAGLDFVDEEDIRFIETEELSRRVAEARATIVSAVQQATYRSDAEALATVVLAGSPNVGKSRLFNALRKRWAVGSAVDALVCERAGTTRDTLTATLVYNETRLQLIDTAGVDSEHRDAIDSAAQGQTSAAVRSATLVLRCSCDSEAPPPAGPHELLVQTKGDLWPASPAPNFERQPDAPRHLPPAAESPLRTSAATGEGLEGLMSQIVIRLDAIAANESAVGASARCREALSECHRALAAASDLAPTGADELVAEELRRALAAVGDVVGETVTDDLLDRIFGQFCIGK